MENYRKKHKKIFRVKKRKSIFRVKSFWLIFLLMVLLGVGGYYGYYYKVFEIKEIIILGNKKIMTEDINSLIKEKITHKIMFIETKNIFLADSEKISEEILLKFPQISRAKIGKNFSGLITAQITERVPVGVICSQECFYFDKEGVVFERINDPADLQSVFLNFETPEYKISLGKQEIYENTIKAAFEIAKSFNEKLTVEIKKMILSFDQKKMIVKTAEGWQVNFDLEENIKNEISNLELLLEEKIPPKERKNLDYIDLRYGNRIFYKKID